MLRCRFAAACLVLLAVPAFAQLEDRPGPRTATVPVTAFGVISGVAGDGYPGYYGDSGPAVSAELNTPQGVFVDTAGNIYIADTSNQVIRKITAATADIATIAGTPESGYAGDNGPATKALLYAPGGVAVDATGDVFSADTGNNVVRRVDAKTGIITTFAGNGFGAGPHHQCGATGDDGPAVKAELCSPSSLAFDQSGNLYISDSGNSIVREVNGKTGVITTVAGFNSADHPAGTYGTAGLSADGHPAIDAFLNELRGITIDASGNLYIAESGECLIRKVNLKSGIISTFAGARNQTVPYGQCGFGPDGVAATESELDGPGSVAVDKAGNLYIADTLNELIRRVDAKSGLITTAAGSALAAQNHAPGEVDYSGDGYLAVNAQISEAYGVATDAEGNFYIADTDNNAIRKVTGTYAVTTPLPVISPVAPQQYIGFDKSIAVTITDTNSAAAIYYTTDGTIPTNASHHYTGPITISATSVVTAFAVASGLPASNGADAAYMHIPAPVISPKGGTYTKAQTVTISNPGFNIMYTIDGSDPATSSTALFYNGSFSVAHPETVRAVSTLNGGIGAIASAAYIIPSAPVVVTGVSPTIISTTSVRLKGTVNSGDLATTYWFNYGTICGALTLSTPKTSMGAGTATLNVQAVLTGLTPNDSYCYQLAASNSLGAAKGEALAF